MLSEIRIYYEGDRLLKEGFDAFFAELRNRARERKCRVRFVPARSGGEACRDFGVAIKANSSSWNILLIDSEGPCAAGSSAELCGQHKWKQAHAKSIFWMVEMMESWFHADKEKLSEFYGQGFKSHALKANSNVEKIRKKDLEAGLKAATKNTLKGNYFDHKTEHGNELLTRVRPALVRDAAPNCGRLFQAVLNRLA